MYIRASTLLFPVFALASLVAAAPGDITTRGGGGGSCTSGTQLCCAQTLAADSVGVALIQSLLGVTVDPVIGPLLAIGCTAFIGSCTAQTTCCQSGQSDNIVYVGCNNIAV
ncbi:hypothetical protein EDC04DRAFT_2607507 [Pisolithus marmoratus]|nr:hypothetical protein EDC04DRAFT_2607507 [Pisolithus marmoratus]